MSLGRSRWIAALGTAVEYTTCRSLLRHLSFKRNGLHIFYKQVGFSPDPSEYADAIPQAAQPSSKRIPKRFSELIHQ
jgi:hypothetical protein